MKRDYKLYLNDIRESIQRIEEYAHHISEEQFKKNKQLQDAVTRRLEIIGEASRNIPRSLKEINKHIPWFDMSQFRDFISHSYFEIGKLTIWKTVKEKIPIIKKGMQDIKLV